MRRPTPDFIFNSVCNWAVLQPIWRRRPYVEGGVNYLFSSDVYHPYLGVDNVCTLHALAVPFDP